MKIAILIASLLVGYGIGYVGAHADVFNCEKDREK